MQPADRSLTGGIVKTCPKCGESKPLSEFNKNKSRKDGHGGYCRPCAYDAIKAYKKANPEKVAARAWNKNHLENRRAAWNKWAKANPEDRRVRIQQYRARKVNNGVNLVTSTETANIVAQPCAACGVAGPSTVDHIIPIARGGAHTIGNLMSLCGRCNSSKRDMLYTEWKYSKRPQAQKAFASP